MRKNKLLQRQSGNHSASEGDPAQHTSNSLALENQFLFGAIDAGSDGGQPVAAGPVKATVSLWFRRRARSAAQTTLRQGMH